MSLDLPRRWMAKVPVRSSTFEGSHLQGYTFSIPHNCVPHLRTCPPHIYLATELYSLRPVRALSKGRKAVILRVGVASLLSLQLETATEGKQRYTTTQHLHYCRNICCLSATTGRVRIRTTDLMSSQIRLTRLATWVRLMVNHR